jgi:hypothetical protein
MSDRNNDTPPSLQGLFSQVLRDIQTGINKLEQSVNAQREGGNVPADAPVWPSPNQPQGGQQTQSQPAPTPKAPSEPYTGQRWEYKVVYVNFRGQISSEGEQVVIGRGERRSSFVRQYLDEIGEQGWELSGVSPLGETENSYMVFKRPATGGKKSSSEPRRASSVEEVEETGRVAEL